MAALTVPYLHVLDMSLPTNVEENLDGWSVKLVSREYPGPSAGRDNGRAFRGSLFPEQSRREVLEVASPARHPWSVPGDSQYACWTPASSAAAWQAANAPCESLRFRRAHPEVEKVHFLRKRRRVSRTRR